MSRAAVSQRQKARKAEARAARDIALMRQVEAYAAQDALVVTCSSCGLVQVTQDDTPCVVCGGEIATFHSFPGEWS